MKTNKPKRKRCKQCKKLYKPINSFQSTCSPSCAIEYTKDKQNRKDVFKSAIAADRKEIKGKLRQLGKSDRSKALRAAQKAFNAFIRERDKQFNCISCGNKLQIFTGVKGQLFDCGHYRSTGSAPHLRFNEDNAHAQCVRCNRYLSGNVERYRDGLKVRIGQKRLDELESNNEVVKYTVDDLWKIEKDYKQKLKELQGD
jgi:hypothetical protein